MCNRPSLEHKTDYGGLFSNLVPTVELAANALAAATSQKLEQFGECEEPDESTQTTPETQSPVHPGSFTYSPISTITSLEEHPHLQDVTLIIPNCDETQEQTRKRSRRQKHSPDNPGWTAKHHRRHFVHHSYHDHSHEADEDLMSAFDKAEQFAAKGGVLVPFPIVLHNMLEAVEKKGWSDIVSWQPHGRAFCVHNPRAFVRQVMPIFFRQTRISSFQRQLNLYGFVRLTGHGPDKGAYYNEYFLRGRLDLAHHIHRTKVKGTVVRMSSNPNEEPDFYKMEPVGDEEDAYPPSPATSDLQTNFDLTPLPISSLDNQLPAPVYGPNNGDSMQFFPVDMNCDNSSVDEDMALFLEGIDLVSDDAIAPFSIMPQNVAQV